MAEYKIKDLEQLTGIKAHTIRIWEKRYNILVPERTETQIRTYTDLELTTLINVSLLNKHGIKISKIAEMTHDQVMRQVEIIQKDKSIDDCQEKLLMSLVKMDEELFTATLSDSIEQIGLEKTFLEQLLPFLERIGIMWLCQTINPAQEHFMSNLIRQKLIHEIAKLPVPSKQKGPVLLYLPEYEWHEISLLFYHYILREHGVNTLYLGQSLPYDAILKASVKVDASCLLTCLLTNQDEKSLTDYFKKLAQDTNLPIFGGGHQIKQHSKALNKWVSLVSDTDSVRAIGASIPNSL